MRRIGLTVLTLLLLILAALGGLTYWFGMQAEGTYNNIVQGLTTSKDGDVTITKSSYERGLLSSTANITLTSASLPIAVIVDSNIQHGPFPQLMEYVFEPMMAKVKSQISVPALKGFPALKASTDIDLGGASRTHLELPPGKSQSGDFEWKAVTGEIKLAPDRKKSNTTLKTPQVTISAMAKKTVLSQISLTVDETEHSSGTRLVDFMLTVDKVGAAAEPTLQGLKIASKSELSSGNLYGVNITADVRGINDGTVTHGPGQLSIQLRNIDMAAINAYQGQLRELKQKTPEQAMMASMGKFMELLGNLTKKIPELELSKLNLKTSGGEITGRSKFVLDGSGLDLAENPMLIVSALRGEGEITVPAGVVKLRAEKAIRERLDTYKQEGKLSPDEIAKLTPERVNAIIDQALPKEMEKTAAAMSLMPAGGDYRFKLSFAQGQLTINDKPLDKPLRLPN